MATSLPSILQETVKSTAPMPVTSSATRQGAKYQELTVGVSKVRETVLVSPTLIFSLTAVMPSTSAPV